MFEPSSATVEFLRVGNSPGSCPPLAPSPDGGRCGVGVATECSGWKPVRLTRFIGGTLDFLVFRVMVPAFAGASG